MVEGEQIVADAIQGLADFLFMPPIVTILLGTGLFLTIRFRGIQLRRMGEAFKAMLAQQSEGATGALSPFQAFMTALAASIGTGNIAGIATAIIFFTRVVLLQCFCFFK